MTKINTTSTPSKATNKKTSSSLPEDVKEHQKAKEMIQTIRDKEEKKPVFMPIEPKQLSKSQFVKDAGVLSNMYLFTRQASIFQNPNILMIVVLGVFLVFVGIGEGYLVRFNFEENFGFEEKKSLFFAPIVLFFSTILGFVLKSQIVGFFNARDKRRFSHISVMLGFVFLVFSAIMLGIGFFNNELVVSKKIVESEQENLVNSNDGYDEVLMDQVDSSIAFDKPPRDENPLLKQIYFMILSYGLFLALTLGESFFFILFLVWLKERKIRKFKEQLSDIKAQHESLLTFILNLPAFEKELVIVCEQKELLENFNNTSQPSII